MPKAYDTTRGFTISNGGLLIMAGGTIPDCRKERVINSQNNDSLNLSQGVTYTVGKTSYPFHYD